MEVKHYIVTANNPCQEHRLHGELVKVIKCADGFFAGRGKSETTALPQSATCYVNMVVLT
jgi:hypothetical protein